MSEPAQIFANLEGGGRIFAVASIHAETARLDSLQKKIGEAFQPGDRLVYLGNYLGQPQGMAAEEAGRQARAAIDSLLLFRRALMARPGVDPEHIVFLRGAQEEMFQKLLQLQFAPNPSQVLQWMLDQGIGATIAAYGAYPQEGFVALKEGRVSLNRWLTAMRETQRGLDGHPQLFSSLKHAAYSDGAKLLFVHAGIDPSRPLTAQSDSFWWGNGGFANLAEPYNGFTQVVRGFDRKGGGVAIGAHTVTLDGGAGRGGSLVAACFGPDGRILDRFEA